MSEVAWDIFVVVVVAGMVSVDSVQKKSRGAVVAAVAGLDFVEALRCRTVASDDGIGQAAEEDSRRKEICMWEVFG